MPMLYKASAQGIKPESIPSPGNNAFAGDVFTSNPIGKDKIASGFYRQEKGEELKYTYEYDEMKIVLEVEGEFTFTDETGYQVSARPGDVFYFSKGTTMTFVTTGYGLAFYTGTR